MSFEPNGELIPVGGGDSIPLVRQTLTVGRRESCDICLRFPNISGVHCELHFKDGIWLIRDLKSTNGVKVNGNKVPKKVLQPGDIISIGKRQFTIDYSATIGSHARNEILEEAEDITSVSLLEKAGLTKPPKYPAKPAPRPVWPAPEPEDDDD